MRRNPHACAGCGCNFLVPIETFPLRLEGRECPNCNVNSNPNAWVGRKNNGGASKLALIAFALIVAAFAGCDQGTYDRGFKAGKKAGYKSGYSSGYSSGTLSGKTQGYAAGTATFVSGTLIPNLGLIVAITTLATATSWLSVHYLIPQHRANQAKYDAKNSIEKTRKQLKAKYQVTVRQEIKRLKTNLKLEKHEQSLQGKLEKLFADASLLLLEDSNRLVDELCNRQLKTIKEIASASDLTTEEKILLYPATANEVSKITKKEKSDV